MKKVMLFVVVSAALIALGFAQTPDASGDSGQVSVQGCLGGSGGNYTVAEDGSGQISRSPPAMLTLSHIWPMR